MIGFVDDRVDSLSLVGRENTILESTLPLVLHTLHLVIGAQHIVHGFVIAIVPIVVVILGIVQVRIDRI